MTTPMNPHRIAAVLLTASLLAACDKNTVQELPFGPLFGAKIKFFNFGVGAPSVNFYADNVKMTAVQSGTGSEATSGVSYGGVGNGGTYSQIAPGTYSITGRIAAATDKDLPIDTLRVAIADGKQYSFYLSGAYVTATKQVDGFIVEDPVPAQDFSTAYVRLVHGIYNANPLTLYARPVGDTVTAHWTVVGSAVAYKAAGAFVTIAPGVYDVGARFTDSTANRITLGGVSLRGGQIYTINARGNNTATTGATRDSLSSTAHF